MSNINDELFEEVYNSADAVDINEIDSIGFMNYCESTYKMTTAEFMKWYEENGFEGNVDHQMWYILSR